MALVDLVSDLSKYRSTVKSTATTTPETSKVKDSRSFGAVLPITERLSQLSPTLQKPKQIDVQAELNKSHLDDIVKKLHKDLIINSVSKYSPINVNKDKNTIGRVSIQEIASKFSNIKREKSPSQLTKSNVLVLKSQVVSNNLVSPIDVNKELPKTLDRSTSSPDINRISQTEDKSYTSPTIYIKPGDQSDDVVNPNTIINKIPLTTDKTTQSPAVFSGMSTPDKSTTSPDILPASKVEDKSKQSPNILKTGTTEDKSKQSPTILKTQVPSDNGSQSPDVFKTVQSMDRTEESPDVFSSINIGDKTKSSPDVFSTIIPPNKDAQSPNIKPIVGDATDNIKDPKIGVLGKPLSLDRTKQTVSINKDIISPINNILNPDIKLDLNVLTFDRSKQSPAIQTNIPVSGYVKNPKTNIFRIEQGTYHLVDESRLNPDGMPFKFATQTKIGDQQSKLQRDSQRYDGKSKQLVDNSQLNLDGVQKTNPSGRNEDPTKSKFSIKGIQSVNFFSDKNAKGFSVKPQKGKTLYSSNSEYSWAGTTAPTITGFNSFVEAIASKLSSKSSKYGWVGSNPSVDYFDVTKQNTSSGFDVFFGSLETKYINESSRFQWKGTRLSAPKVNYFDDKNATGFGTFALTLESKYAKNTSDLTFKSTLPTPVNFITDRNANGFTNKTTLMKTQFKKDTSGLVFKGTSKSAPAVNYFTNTYNTGFTDFAQSLKTEFNPIKTRLGFNGIRSSAPSVNYLTDTNSTGFTNLAESLKSNYDQKPSRFTWVGTREQAPEVDYFGIPGPNPKAVAGFTRLFTDKTATKLTDNYSRLSFMGTTVRSDVKPVPFTKFFGFKPGELSGFMVGMEGRESSLYPILEPRLFPDSPAATRYAIEASRAQNKRQRTTDDVSKYVPISLGGLPWFDGKNFGVATLGNQVPFIQTKVAEGYGSTYFRKYERLAKDSTDGNGYLTKWATKRRSPSPLDMQYSKYSLQKDSFNNDIIGAFRQPYIVRGIQREGEVENQRWGFGANVGGVPFDEGIVRGGAVTQAERIAMDAYRLVKWTASMKGVLFNAKQVGLQLMNPNVDINPKKPESGLFGMSATQIFNPILNPLLINTVTARAGAHFARHGVVQFSSNFLNRYEDATLDRESNSKFIDRNYTAFESKERPTVYGQQTNYNRLIGLLKELLPNSFKPVITPANTGDAVKNAVTNKALDLAKQLTGMSGIARLSSKFGGPQSFLGIGGTTINRPKHPYLTHYTTTPLLMLTGQQKEPQYQESAKRDTFYAATAMYKDLFGDVLRTIAYNLENGPYEINDESLPRDTKKIKNIQPIVVDRISKQNPFNPQYDLFDNRLKPIRPTDVQRDGNISDGINPKNVDLSNPLKQYRALSYDKLGVSRDRKRSRSGMTHAGEINDFREDLNKDAYLNAFSSDPSVIDYANQNLEDKFGFGKHGKAGVDKSNPGISNIQYGRNSKNLSVPTLKRGGEFRGDRINIIDYKRGVFDLSKDAVYEKGKYNNDNLPGTDDLVEFYFTGVNLHGTENAPAESIVFRATFGNISDSHNAEWTPVDYIGRADPLYVYKGYTRQIGFDFTATITSRDEMKAMWRKLNHLASWTAPEYKTTGFMKAPIIRLNIGHLYRKLPGFLSQIEYSIDNAETTWETAQLKNDMTLTGPDGRLSGPGVLQLPKHVRVNCSFTPIGMYRPEYNGIMYSLYDDTVGGELETGLAPTSNEKVNYFRTYEVDNNGKEEPGGSVENTKYYRIPPGTDGSIPEILPENIESLS